MRSTIAAAPIRMPTTATAVGALSPVRTEPVFGLTPFFGIAAVVVTVVAAVVAVVCVSVCVSVAVSLVTGVVAVVAVVVLSPVSAFSPEIHVVVVVDSSASSIMTIAASASTSTLSIRVTLLFSITKTMSVATL